MNICSIAGQIVLHCGKEIEDRLLDVYRITESARCGVGRYDANKRPVKVAQVEVDSSPSQNRWCGQLPALEPGGVIGS